MKLLNQVAIVYVLMLALPDVAMAQSPTVERTFAYPEDVIRLEIQRLNALEGRLPSVEGFAMIGAAPLARYSLPYYQLQLELKPDGNGKTVVRVSSHITALYDDPGNQHPAYRSLESTGRLELDVLERLQRELSELASKPTLDRKDLEAALADLRLQHQSAEQRRSELNREIRDLERLQQELVILHIAAVRRAGTAVFAAPAANAPLLFRARSRDEFELIGQQNGWAHVRLGGNAGGWILRSELNEVDSTAGFVRKRPDFEVIREEVMRFAGNWASLKGRPTLFLWVRPTTAVIHDHWQYVQQVFEQHDQAQWVDGIVVVFPGDGAVAAATTRDIRHWTQGALSEASFKTRCSLDPPRLFLSSAHSIDTMTKGNRGQ